MWKQATLLLLVAHLGIPTISTAQYDPADAPAAPSRWKPVRFAFGIGADNDHFQRMSFADLMAFAKDPNAMARDLSMFEEESIAVTRGGALYANIAFAPKTVPTGVSQQNQEIQVGVGMHSPKEAMVTFKNKDLDTTVVYCNLHSEFTLETAYLRKGKWGKHFEWYAGLGANGGLTFGNEMVLIAGRYLEPGQHPSTMESQERNKQRFEARSVKYVRTYIPYGIHYGFGRHWSVGFDMRTGIGWQFINGDDPNFIERTGAFIIGAKYRF